MCADGGLPVQLAEQAAFLDVRERVLDPARGVIGEFAAAGFGPIELVRVQAHAAHNQGDGRP